MHVDLRSLFLWLCALWRTRVCARTRAAGQEMQGEHDFSKGERGRFYRAGAELIPPPPTKGNDQGPVAKW